MIRTIERATGNEFQAKRIEGGYKVYTLAGEPYKKLKESTFKRYFIIQSKSYSTSDVDSYPALC